MSAMVQEVSAINLAVTPEFSLGSAMSTMSVDLLKSYIHKPQCEFAEPCFICLKQTEEMMADMADMMDIGPRPRGTGVFMADILRTWLDTPIRIPT